jgi:hypothetical protein
MNKKVNQGYGLIQNWIIKTGPKQSGRKKNCLTICIQIHGIKWILER